MVMENGTSDSRSTEYPNPPAVSAASPEVLAYLRAQGLDPAVINSLSSVTPGGVGRPRQQDPGPSGMEHWEPARAEQTSSNELFTVRRNGDGSTSVNVRHVFPGEEGHVSDAESDIERPTLHVVRESERSVPQPWVPPGFRRVEQDGQATADPQLAPTHTPVLYPTANTDHNAAPRLQVQQPPPSRHLAPPVAAAAPAPSTGLQPPVPLYSPGPVTPHNPGTHNTYSLRSEDTPRVSGAVLFADHRSGAPTQPVPRVMTPYIPSPMPPGLSDAGAGAGVVEGASPPGAPAPL